MDLSPKGEHEKGITLKIVIASDTYPPDFSCSSVFSSNLAHGLSARGHEVHVLAPSQISRPYIASDGLIKEHRLRSHEYPYFRGFFWSTPWEINSTVRRILIRLQPDVVHVQSHISIGRSASRWANELGIPLVATNHFTPENFFDHLTYPLPKLITKRLSSIAWRDLGIVLQRADRLAAPSPPAITIMRKHAHLGGGIPISNGVNLQRYQDAVKKAPRNKIPHLLYAGRLDPQKHVDNIIDALALLQPSTQLHFDVVGTGSRQDDLRRKAANLRVSDRITFHGFLPEADLVNIFARSDIFVNASTTEIQSQATLEAMSCGKPVILANAMGLPHLVKPGVNGYLFQPGDVEALSDYLERLAQNEQKRRFMGKMSLEMAKPHDFERTLDNYEALYRSAIEDNSTINKHLDAIDPDYVFPEFD